jgi:plastocyanin
VVYQTIKHDIWEADIAMSPIILNTQIAGRDRKLIAAMRTDGVLFVVDRETGKPILPIEDRKVAQDKASRTWPTQPYPVGADRMLDDCDTWNKKPIPLGFKVGCFFTAASMDVPNLLTPAWGMRQTPMACSPQTGYIYALGSSSLQWFRRAEDPSVFILGAGRVPGMPQGHGVMAAIDADRESRGSRSSRDRVRRARSRRRQACSSRRCRMGICRRATARPANDLAVPDRDERRRGAGVSYEVDGSSIAIAGRNSIMALTLNGTLEPKAEEVAAGGGRGGRGGAAGPGQGDGRGGLFNGPIADNFRVEIASYVRDNSSGGVRMYTDEHAFNPYRVRVKAGTMVRWVNNGRILHTIAAEDGSWTSSRLVPLEAYGHTFDTPGEYTVICKDHPFAKMQVIVTP